MKPVKISKNCNGRFTENGENKDKPTACTYGGEPDRLPAWSSLPRSHFISNSYTKFDFCSYEQARWPAWRASHLCTGEISVGGMNIFQYEHSIQATETKMLPVLMRYLSKQWAYVSFLTRVQFLSRQAGWDFSMRTKMKTVSSTGPAR